MCPMCEGRGWQWVGSVHNADREVCELCAGKGVGRLKWQVVGMLLVTLAGWALALGLIWYVTTSV